jgi:hypothetical protein
MKKITLIKQLMIFAFLSSAVCFAQNKTLPAKYNLKQKGQKMIAAKTFKGAEISPNIYGGTISASRSVLDILYSYDAVGVQEGGVETDGNFIYTSDWNNAMFYKYSMTGTLLDSFSITSVSGIRDLAFDGTYFYGGANAETIYKMDFTNKMLLGTITCPTGTTVRHIAYDSDRKGFWVGGWATDVICVDTTGTVLDTILAANHGLTSTYGSAYDKWSPGGPYLWMFDQGTNGTGAFFNQISLTTKLPTGVVHDCSDISSTALAGGAFCYNNAGTVTLGGLVQGEKIFAYDITPSNVDAGIFNILSPTNSNSCTLTSTESITVAVKNYGLDTIFSINVSYKINSGNPVIQTVNDTILPGAIVNYTFPSTVDLSAFGTYAIKAYTTLAGDNSNSNDTLSKTVISADAIITVNIQTDDYGSETSWQLANATTGAIVATGGPYTDVSGGEFISTNVCALSSECYNFTIYDAYGDGNCCSFGNGSYEIQWNGVSFGINPGSFTTSATVNNICKPLAKDLGVTAITAPVSACSLTSAEDVVVTIHNFGSDSISSFQVAYKLNNGTDVIANISQTINVNQNVTYTFSGANAVNLSAPGSNTITAYTILSGDGNNNNDTTSVKISSGSSSVPYSMGFETTEDFTGWKIEDANNDGYTWTISSTGGNNGPYCAMYSYNQDGATAADDWLITKCIDLQASKSYHISYFYKVGDATYPENFTVNIGASPVSTAMTTQLGSYPNLTNTTYMQSDTTFTVPSSGTYYLGFQCNSAANEYNLYLDDINITDVTGIKENSYSANVNVYPNPAKNVLNISSTENISNVKMMNVFGQIIFSNNVNGNNTVINTSDYAEGVYYIQMQTEKGIVTKNISIIK